jgi:hypothetical protein
MKDLNDLTGFSIPSSEEADKLACWKGDRSGRGLILCISYNYPEQVSRGMTFNALEAFQKVRVNKEKWECTCMLGSSFARVLSQ